MLFLIAYIFVGRLGARRPAERVHDKLTFHISEADSITYDALGDSLFGVGAHSPREDHFAGSYMDRDVRRVDRAVVSKRFVDETPQFVGIEVFGVEYVFKISLHGVPPADSPCKADA
ncbi:MAG TPA: hypothetical protein VIC03_04255 [Gemmatimonadaceae bacterium]